MIASQASKLPSNLSIRVCILSLRLVTIFRSNCQGGVIRLSSHQITRHCLRPWVLS